MEPQGLAGALVARAEWPLARKACSGESARVAYGVPNIREHFRSDSVPDSDDRPQDCPSLAGVESVAGRVLPSCGPVQAPTALLINGHAKRRAADVWRAT